MYKFSYENLSKKFKFFFSKYKKHFNEPLNIIKEKVLVNNWVVRSNIILCTKFLFIFKKNVILFFLKL